MAKNFSNQLAGQIGESLVVAELGRRRIVATAFAGNVPDIDILAYKDGKTLHLQVKAWRSGAVSVNASRFLDISINEAKGTQTVNGLSDDLDEDLIYVFVNISQVLGHDKFYVLRQGDLARSIMAGYVSFLDKHNGVRPRNHASTHASVGLEHLQAYEANWGLIEGHFD
ncbi:hypothetical protein [Pseudophaeobacter sp. A-200-2]|uniref:hypothetical protein n=1 Tax=Pseudophaeobacter sp. A-200-2 TaxID=3098145 RepID=UPI0034D6D74F